MTKFARHLSYGPAGSPAGPNGGAVDDATTEYPRVPATDAAAEQTTDAEAPDTAVAVAADSGDDAPDAVGDGDTAPHGEDLGPDSVDPGDLESDSGDGGAADPDAVEAPAGSSEEPEPTRATTVTEATDPSDLGAEPATDQSDESAATAPADADAGPADTDTGPTGADAGSPSGSGVAGRAARGGATTVADEVVEKVAVIAARKVSGVHGLGTGAARLLGSGHGADDKGLAVRIDGQTATIAVTVVVEYGNRVYDVANRLRDEVAEAVESMVGVDVVAVDIVVEDVHIPE